MKKTVSRLGSAALCVTLSLALGCGCAVMPPASSEKPASSAVSVPTDAEGKPLYDAATLEDALQRPQVRVLQQQGALRFLVLLEGRCAPGRIRKIRQLPLL